jgi:hypothetical protein
VQRRSFPQTTCPLWCGSDIEEAVKRARGLAPARPAGLEQPPSFAPYAFASASPPPVAECPLLAQSRHAKKRNQCRNWRRSKHGDYTGRAFCFPDRVSEVHPLMRYTQNRGFFPICQFSETIHRPFFVIFPVRLIHLVTDFIYFAIGLDFGFIAPDNSQYLCVTFGHLGGIPSLSLRVRRYGGNQQDGNKYLRANGRVVRQRENQAARRQSKSRAIHACCSRSRRSANGDQP